MSYDFYTAYDWSLLETITQKSAIDYLTKKNTNPPKTMPTLAEVSDIDACLRLLVLALRTVHKDYARVGESRNIGGLLRLYSSELFSTYLNNQHKNYLDPFGIVPDPARIPLSLLPPHSAFIQFTFTLAKPYISRDDEPFHINDNPVRKDKVFKVPMVAPTNWKGNLRWTARQLEPSVDEKTIVRLFGNKKDEEENHLAGALHFYPTFFDRIGLEVINPHDRKTRAGKLPIYFECVPVGATGTFSLLYAPLPSGENNEQQAHDDLKVVARAVAAMMLTYGFSAKKSSGYGEAKDEIEGNVSTIQGDFPLTSLEKLTEEVANVKWN